MATFKQRCDDGNKVDDRRTGGAKVVKPEPAWKQGPFG